MTSYEPFIEPADQAKLQGHRYLVLRATGPLAATWDRVTTSARTSLAHLPVTFPARGHVTLGGCADGGIEVVQAVVGQLASSTPSLLLDVEGIDFFPSPFQIVVLRVRTTPALADALRRFRTLAKESGLSPFEHIPVEHWTFHLSVAYCRRLSTDEWNGVVAVFKTLERPLATELAISAELVVFDEGREYSGGIYPLAGPGGA